MQTSKNFCNPCDIMVYSRVFDGGVDELVDYVGGPDSEQAPRTEWRAYNETYETTHTNSFKQALTLGRYGWYDGRADILNALDEFDIVTGGRITEKLDQRYGVSGDDYDIGRFTSGDPNHMINDSHEPVKTPGRPFLITYQSRFTINESPKEVLKRGITIGGAAMALERAGMPVQITVINSTHNVHPGPDGSNLLLDYYIPLNRPGQPLDLARLAFGLCHPAFQRRLIHASVELEPDYIRRAMNAGEFQRMPRGYGYMNLRPVADHFPPGVVSVDNLASNSIGLQSGPDTDGSIESIRKIIAAANTFYLQSQAQEAQGNH